MLFQHMGDKKEDDEFVLQITFTFAKLLSFEATRKRLLEDTDVLHYLVDLVQDKNKEVCDLQLCITEQEHGTCALCHRITFLSTTCIFCQAL